MSTQKKINTEVKNRLKSTMPDEEQAFFEYVFENRHDIKEKRFSEIEEKFGDAWNDFFSQKIKDNVNDVLKSPFLLEDKRKLFFEDVFQHRHLLQKNPKSGVDLYLNVEQTFGADWKNFYAEKINAEIKEILSEIKTPSAIPIEGKEEFFKYMLENRHVIEKELFDKFEKKFDEEWTDFSKKALDASEKNLFSQFRKGNTSEYIKTLETLSPSASKRELTQGPLPKNEETILLESMIKSILTDFDSVKLEIRNNNQLIATYQNKEYPIHEMMQKFDFNQPDFNQDLERYEQLLRNRNTELRPQTKDTYEDMDGIRQKIVITDIDELNHKFSERDAKSHLKDLSLGEKLAINIYTTGAFTEINQLLRGQISQLNENQPSSERLKELLLVSAIGAHGLNKIADEVPISTFRVDENLPTDLIEARKQAAKNNGITREMGLLSSAQIKPAANFVMSSEQSTATVFTGLVGKNVAAISNVPEEGEWLIPPTQIQWHNVAEIEGKHYFSASPVRSLDAPDAYISSAEKKKIINDLQTTLTLFIDSLSPEEKTEFYQSAPTDKKYHYLSEKILTKLNQHFENKGLELQQKIMENKNTLPENLRAPLSVIMRNLKVENPAELSIESKETLSQSPKGGYGESNEIGTEKIKESLDKISNLIKTYENSHTHQNQIDLLNEIDKFMNMADWKITNNASKNKMELRLQTHVISDTQLMLNQMRVLASYGQALSGNNQFGQEKIAHIEQAIGAAPRRISRLNRRESSPEEPAFHFPILNQPLKSNYGIFSNAVFSANPVSVPTANMNQSLNTISSLLNDYRNYADKNSDTLIAEINHYFFMADMKIASNMQKSEKELENHPHILKNTFIIMAQMEALASIGKTLSGDNQFGETQLSRANQAISKKQESLINASPTRPVQSAPPAKPVEEQFKQDEALWKAYLENKEGTAQNTDVLKRIFYLVQQGGLTARPGDEIKNKTNEIPLAAALSHGERILIEIPPLADNDNNPNKLFDWIRGGHDIPTRSAATHSLKINGSHDIEELKLGGFDAKKGKFPSRKDLKKYENDNRKHRHFGLNVGLAFAEDDKGNKTIPIAALENGENGHLYIYYKKPTKAKPATLTKPARPAKPGALLIGLESAEHGKHNNLTGAGHTTGGSANELSATGGLKWTDKAFADHRPQNGFYVDLSDPEKLNGIINSNPEAYRHIQNNLGNPISSPPQDTSPKHSVENIIASLPNIQIPNQKSSVNNHYNYEEYHYQENQKTDTVGTNNKLEVRVFNDQSYNGPKTEDFIRRAESLHSAAISIIPSELSSDEKQNIILQLNTHLKNVKEQIQKKADINPAEMQKTNTNVAYFADKHGAALNILQNFVAANLNALDPTGKLNSKAGRDQLAEAESKVVAVNGRANLLHIYDVADHTRISLAQAQGDHTNPSTMRDKPELSNFVKVSSGYVDNNGNAKIEFTGHRHSSYPATKILGNDIESKMKRRESASQSVKQMVGTLAQEMIFNDPSILDKQPIEIKLSSMMLLTPIMKDQYLLGGDSEMRQLKDSLIGLNINNRQTIPMTLMINGVPTEVQVKPILTQMNIPANDIIKAQTKSLGGKYNDEVNRKGFYEYHKNFMEFMTKPENSHPLLENFAQYYQEDQKLNTLEAKLKDLTKDNKMEKLYKNLGELQGNPEKADEYKALLKEIRVAEKEINGVHKEIIKRQKEIWDEPFNQIKDLRANIKSELAKDPENKALQVAQLYLDSAEIFYSKAHKQAEHGHQFQTRYLLANQLMGHHVEFFCKSGEDRTGRSNNYIEEFLAFRHKNGAFPEFKNEADLAQLEKISLSVHHGSVSKKITDQNAPGAEGLQQNEFAGKQLQLVDFDKKMATLAKDVYENPSKLTAHFTSKNVAAKAPSKEEKMIQELDAEFHNLFSHLAENPKSFGSVAVQPKTEQTLSTSQQTNPELSSRELSLENRAIKIMVDLDKTLKDIEDGLKPGIEANKPTTELSQIYRELQTLKSENSDSKLNEKINQMEGKIKTYLDLQATRVHSHTQTPTGESVISGGVRPQQRSPAQIQDNTFKTLTSVLPESKAFSLERIPRSESVLVKKDGEDFISANSKEIQSLSVSNEVDDYKQMIQAAAKMFNKPLQIYVSESEKPKLDEAIRKLTQDPKTGLKKTDFECTTNRQEYEAKQKIREETPKAAPVQPLTPRPEEKPDERPH